MRQGRSIGTNAPAACRRLHRNRYLGHIHAGRRRALRLQRRAQIDPVLGGLQLTTVLGPDNAPPESFSQATMDRILALT